LKQNREQLTKIPLKSLRIKNKSDVLAMGPELKANYCIIKNSNAFLYTGFTDLKDPRFFSKYKTNILRQLNRLKVRPRIIACDLNPVFLSSRLAEELMKKSPKDCRLIPVQHHHAHISAGLSLLGLLNKKSIGVVCDGTGLGDDGKVWGCEFITYNQGKFSRVGHLNNFALPGGDKAVIEPWRVALALLYKAYKRSILELPIPFLKKKKFEIEILIKMIEQKINTPLSSSAGRLFDGVSSLCGLKSTIKTEAEAAIALEKQALKAKDKENSGYQFSIEKMNNELIINTDRMIRQIVSDINKKKKVQDIAARFHNTFAEMIIDMCKKIKKKDPISNVLLCGGVFFNSIVKAKVLKGLNASGFIVHLPGTDFLGDASLSLGQAVMALQRADA